MCAYQAVETSQIGLNGSERDVHLKSEVIFFFFFFHTKLQHYIQTQFSKFILVPNRASYARIKNIFQDQAKDILYYQQTSALI